MVPRQNQQRPQEQPKPVNPMQKTSGAERNMKIVVKGGRSTYNEVESLKEKVFFGYIFRKNINKMVREIYFSRQEIIIKQLKCIVNV